MSGSDKVYIPEWMPERQPSAMRLVVCDEVQEPHSYGVCSCTPNHRNPRLVPSWQSADPLTRLADSIAYSFAIGRYGDMKDDENFARAVGDVRTRLLGQAEKKTLKQCLSLVCRCGAKVEIETHGWGPVEHSEPWMCPKCRKEYMELCERQIDESSR